MASPRKINVISAEFNGCLYNEGYIFYRRQRVQSEDPFIKTNRRFINHLANKIARDGFEQAHVLIGSQRQDPFIDRGHVMIKDTPSVVFGLGTLVTELGKAVHARQSNNPVIPEQFLLGDAFYQYPPDDDATEDNTYEAIQDSLDKQGKFTPAFNQQVNHANKALADESYVLMLYAQMHKMAAEHPNDDIAFDYYHHSSTALNKIDAFFGQHPELIPGSVKLNLHQYKGEYDDRPRDDNDMTELAEQPDQALINTIPGGIQGSGAIDYNYNRNVHRLAEGAGINVAQKLQSDNRECDIAASYANNQKALANFNKKRKLIGQVLTKDGLQKKVIDRDHINGNFNPYLMIQDLRNEINRLEDALRADRTIDLKQNTEFVTALNMLCDDLAEDLTAQAQKGTSPVLIRQSHAMQVAKNTARLVTDLQNDLPAASKLSLIDTYIKDNQKKTGAFKNFLKGIAVVAIAAAGFVLGAVIGAGIGIAAGAWSGPGAAISGLAGLFTGAVTGAAIGVAAGAAATGLGAGALSAWLLFRKDKVSKDVTNVGGKAKLFTPPVPQAEPDGDHDNNAEHQPLLLG